MSYSAITIIEIPFDLPRKKKDGSNLDLSSKWVTDRIKHFEKYTLNSLLNQTFQGFEIWLYCGLKHKAITAAHPWHPKIKIMYDQGHAELTSISADFLVITRIDSDDMFHVEALQEIRDRRKFNPHKRVCMMFRKNLVWNPDDKCINKHYRRSPPFYTHIFPKSIYKNWDLYKSQHFTGHGNAGGYEKDTIGLTPHRVMVIKHKYNVSYINQGRRGRVTPEVKERLKKQGKFVTDDPKKMKAILKDYGAVI